MHWEDLEGSGGEGEVGGGIGMGNTCKSMADSFQCMTKPTTKKKKKNRVQKYTYTNLVNRLSTKLQKQFNPEGWHFKR